MIEEAISFLRENRREYADIIDALLFSSFSLDCFSEDGISVSSRWIAIASAFPGGSAERLGRHIPERRGYSIHGRELYRHVIGLHPSEEATYTSQEVYMKSSIEASLPPGCSIRALTPEDLDFVSSHYSLSGRDYVLSRLEAGEMIGLEDRGELVGFTGRHAEGSMGMLEVVPEHRRKGYGEILERFMIRKVLSEGRIPYCHIIKGNDKSMNLQRKLGLEEAEEPVYWFESI